MALRSNKRLILLQTESSYGTENAPTEGEAVLVSNLSITPQSSDVVSRNLIRPYYGASQQLLANTKVECSFSVELAGGGMTSGESPTVKVPQYGKALEACGMTVDTTVANTFKYQPSSATFPSLTIHYHVDGIIHKVLGCRGSVSITANVGEIPMLEFSFTGVYVDPTNATLPTPQYGNQADPVLFKNGNTTGFELLSFSGALQSFSFDLGNEIVYRELVGGSKDVLITNRSAGGSVSIEAPPLTGSGNFDFFAPAVDDDRALGNLQFTHGTVQGNKVQFISDKVDIGDVAYGEQDGIVMLEIPYTCVPESAANTDFSLIYT